MADHRNLHPEGEEEGLVGEIVGQEIKGA